MLQEVIGDKLIFFLPEGGQTTWLSPLKFFGKVWNTEKIIWDIKVFSQKLVGNARILE